MTASGTAPTIIGRVSRAPAARLESGVASLADGSLGVNAEKRSETIHTPIGKILFFIVPITGRDTVRIFPQ